MTKERLTKIAIVGNPNSGKTTLFNLLTGLNQKTSNFPGVTVEIKSSKLKLDSKHIEIFDLPGTYSLYPNSSEERIVIETLCNPASAYHPDIILFVADLNHIERHLLLATQIADLGIPMVFIANMVDTIPEDLVQYYESKIQNLLEVQVVSTSTRDASQLAKLKKVIIEQLDLQGHRKAKDKYFYRTTVAFQPATNYLKDVIGITNDYMANLVINHSSWLSYINEEVRVNLATKLPPDSNFIRGQINETLARYATFEPIVHKAILNDFEQHETFTQKLDKVITHKIWGPLIFLIIIVTVFQSIFSWAEVPMGIIEAIFADLGGWLVGNLPNSILTRLLVEGILPGIGGVLVFVPQIAILFFLLGLLEEFGYMSRVVYMFDQVMRGFGMNGRSMVSLISSGACAIPAIMSTRTIANKRERLITILVSPLISCSARLPIYAILVGFVVPPLTVLGFLNAQGLVFLGLYVLGVVSALGAALVFKVFIRNDEPTYLMLELPTYKKPLLKNVFYNMLAKVRTFVVEAGKVIFIISILLWFGASFGPSDRDAALAQQAIEVNNNATMSDEDKANLINTQQLETSYIGILGKKIEPVIEPLGYDWKIGIALITSFAAREVFVGTMATLYSVGQGGDEELADRTLRQKMQGALRLGSNEKLYGPATALSLLVFYVFAMQCMSTLAVTKRETQSWKWPVIQFVYMTALAYISAFAVFNIMS